MRECYTPALLAVAVQLGQSPAPRRASCRGSGACVRNAEGVCASATPVARSSLPPPSGMLYPSLLHLMPQPTSAFTLTSDDVAWFGLGARQYEADCVTLWRAPERPLRVLLASS
jgi:hypothetical protein